MTRYSLIVCVPSVALLLCSSQLHAHPDSPPVPEAEADPWTLRPAPVDAAQVGTDRERGRHRLLPLMADRAAKFGYDLPPPLGISTLAILTDAKFTTDDLAVAVARDRDPPDDARLIPLPSVTTSKLEGDNRLFGGKGDLWLFPWLNLFAAIAKVKGTTDIDVRIDLDALLPPPICRPQKPCGVTNLPVTTYVDNTTITLGAAAIYGSKDWFVLGTVSKTTSISSKERSNVKSTSFGIRAGPRIPLRRGHVVSPYAGLSYFDLETMVNGLVRSGPVLPDGGSLHVRYEVKMSTAHPWAALFGVNFELARHWFVQTEFQRGKANDRWLTTVTYRF